MAVHGCTNTTPPHSASPLHNTRTHTHTGEKREVKLAVAAQSPRFMLRADAWPSSEHIYRARSIMCSLLYEQQIRTERPLARTLPGSLIRCARSHGGGDKKLRKQLSLKYTCTRTGRRCETVSSGGGDGVGDGGVACIAKVLPARCGGWTMDGPAGRPAGVRRGTGPQRYRCDEIQADPAMCEYCVL